MTKVYCCDLGQATQEDYGRLYALASPQRQARASACRHRSDALACLAAEALLRWAFPEADLSQMVKHPNGKPYLPGLEFNLSHSGPWVALAVGEGPVGVDVECFRPDLPMEKIAARHFTPEERRLADTPEDFLRIWTAKESYLKRLGKGLAGISDACDLEACRTWLLPGAVLTTCGDELPSAWEPVTLSQLLREN